jgi:hypothetical protein
MYLNQFESTDKVRLSQILATLENIHGIKINIDLNNSNAASNLAECKKSYETMRDRIVRESDFNSYQQNPEYIKSMLILEAVKLMLTEIAPKRRRTKKMNESTMDEAMEGKPTISTQLSAIAAKVPQTSESATAFSNALASIADKLAASTTAFATHDSKLDPDEKMILGWIKTLPRPIHVGNMIKSGVEKFGSDLLAKRMAHVKSLPKVDLDEENEKGNYWEVNFDNEHGKPQTQYIFAQDAQTAISAVKAKNKGKGGFNFSAAPANRDDLNEISKDLAKRYDKAAHDDYWKTYDNADKKHSSDYTSTTVDPDSEKRMQKRERGLDLARGKLGVPGYGLRTKVPAKETRINENLSPDQLNKIVSLGRAMVDYATKTHGTDAKELTSLNAISRVGDKLSHMGTAFGPSRLTDNEKKIVKLAQLKMKAAGQLDQDLDEDLEIMTAETNDVANPGMDNVHEDTLDQDHDGDHDFADVMIARMMRSGMSRAEAIAKTKNKSYNKEGVLAESDTLSRGTVDTSSMPGQATFSQAHHYEYQASMARSELYRNAKYAMSMIKQVDPNGEVPPWIAGCLTKSANILDKIFHYLDYYKTFEPQQLPEDMGSDMELGETSGSIARENLMLIMEYSTKLFNMIKPGDKLEGWVAMKLTTASECISSSKHYMDYVQFEEHAMDDHFDEARRATRKSVSESQLLEDEDPNNEDLAKAQLILNAKALSGKVQDMAEDVAKLSVNDLMPLVDSMRTQFGPESASGFNETVKAALDQLLDTTTQTKDTIDSAVTTLQGGGVPAETTDIEQAAPAGTPPEGDLTAEEPASEEPALGRAKKPELEEAWDTKMHTAKKDKGKWDNFTIAELKAKKDKLMKKKSRTAAEQKEVKQIEFAIRAKQKDHWGKIKEGAMTCTECGTGTYMEDKDGQMRCNECGAMMMSEGWPGYKKNIANQKKVMSRTDKEWNSITKINSDHPVVEGIFSKKSKPVLTRISPDTPSMIAAKNSVPMRPGEKRITKMSPDQAIDKEDVPAYLRKQSGSKVTEVAPPGKKAEEFINDRKEDFKKRYGKNWERVLYATAWKQFGPKHEVYEQALAALAETKLHLEKLTSEMKTHKISFKQMVSEGLATDPLNVGYGLEGEAIRQQMILANKKIAEQKSVVRQIMQEGVIGMIQNINALNKARKLEAVKNSTPYGVHYNTAVGRKSKKMFESADTRAYWLELHGSKISNVRMIEPETFDQAIINKIKA